MLTRKCDICGAEMRKTTPRYKVTFDGWLYTEEIDICIDCFKRIVDEIRPADTPQTETQTETQNSNLTFEKDECAKEYEELGLKELKELIEADRKTESNSEKPNNCEDAENPSGEVWECGCFLDTYCEHQIYDRNPDGTINIVECGYKPKDEPQTESK